MTSVVWRAASSQIVATAEAGGKAEEATGEGKIKARTSRLGRSVVLIGHFGFLRTSSGRNAMCTLSENPAISNRTCTSRRTIS